MQGWRAPYFMGMLVSVCMWWNGKEARRGSWNQNWLEQVGMAAVNGCSIIFPEMMRALLVYGVLGSSKSMHLYL